MEQKKYKLTISVLASNRKDTLPKTLQSIKPILDNVSSELIVTDTGCDEELLAVIREYTDKIVKFEWCKDFSKARNVSVKMAQGQWYMFDIQEELKKLPEKPGVYIMKDKDDNILYVGKAVVLKNRVRQYFQKTKKFYKTPSKMDFEISSTIREMS